MANPEKEFGKLLDDFDADQLEKVITAEERKLTEAQREELKKTRKLILSYLELVCKLVFRAYRMMGSTIAVDALLDEQKRAILTGGLKVRVRHGFKAAVLGLVMNEKHCQHDPVLANAVQNAITLMGQTSRFLNTYTEMIEKNWNNKGVKAMLADVGHRYESDLGYMEQAVVHGIPELESYIRKEKKDTETKLRQVAAA